MFPTVSAPSPTMLFIYALSVFLIVYTLVRTLFSRLTTAEDHVRRAKTFVQYFRAHKKAIAVLEEGLKLPRLTEHEIWELNFRLGIQYFRLRDFSKAVEYFDRALPRVAKKKLAFDPGYLDMIMSYYNAGKTDTARTLYHRLLARQYEDARFGMVTTLDSRIFKEKK